MQAVVQSTQEISSGPLQLRVYPGADCRGTLYQDDGHTFAFQRGEFLRVNYSCQASAGRVTISGNVEKDGYKPWWTGVSVTIYGAGAAPKEVLSDGQAIREVHYDAATHSATFVLTGKTSAWTVEVSY